MDITKVRNKRIRYLITLIAVIISGVMQATIIQTFILPIGLLSSGFTGFAILIEKITSTFLGFNFPTSIGMLVLNIPVAIICSKSISRRFTFFSLVQVFVSSFCLTFLNLNQIFDDLLLNIIFGGFLNGIMVVIALKADASTGGTDFIALYVSNKIGKSIFKYVFIFNTLMLLVFGSMFGWESAGYSILFQFISTKTIESFYNRYTRVTLQIITSNPDVIIEKLLSNHRHGITRVEGKGVYSSRDVTILYTVVSGYEEAEIVTRIKRSDKNAIVNTYKTDNFYGGFYLKPIE